MYYNICIYNTHSWNYCQIFLKIGVSLDPTMWWICKKGRFQAGYYIYIYILIYVYYMDVQDEPSPKNGILNDLTHTVWPISKWSLEVILACEVSHTSGWSHATFFASSLSQARFMSWMMPIAEGQSCFKAPPCTTWVTSLLKILPSGDGSKPWYLVNPKIAGKWMFIPLKMYL